MNRFILFLIFAVLLIPSTGCYAHGPWSGKVVDAETKQPIEGAAVVAVWIRETGTPAGTDTGFVDAAETLTDKNGEFEISSKRFLSIIGIRYIKGPFFTIYKPGYGSYPKYDPLPGPHAKIIAPHLTPSEYFQAQGTVVELPRLKTKEERLRTANDAEGSVGELGRAPFKKTPKFLNLLNSELKDLGIDVKR